MDEKTVRINGADKVELLRKITLSELAGWCEHQSERMEKKFSLIVISNV